MSENSENAPQEIALNMILNGEKLQTLKYERMEMDQVCHFCFKKKTIRHLLFIHFLLITSEREHSEYFILCKRLCQFLIPVKCTAFIQRF